MATGIAVPSGTARPGPPASGTPPHRMYNAYRTYRTTETVCR